jgi:uracil-DNA glycosylase family 4
VPFRTFNKQPPTKHYYWIPNIGTWPSRVEDFGGNFYGPYFAYLMGRHRLHNVYITNLVKCKWAGEGDATRWKSQAIVDHCMERFLAREIQIFSPHIAFCFGRRAEAGWRSLPQGTTSLRPTYLYHPSAIDLARRHRKTRQEMVDCNDERIRQAISHST